MIQYPDGKSTSVLILDIALYRSVSWMSGPYYRHIQTLAYVNRVY
jgi:hypothetical protein